MLPKPKTFPKLEGNVHAVIHETCVQTFHINLLTNRILQIDATIVA